MSRVLLILIAMTLASPGPARGQTPVGTDQEGSRTFIVLDSGDVYSSDYAGSSDLGYPQQPWRLCGRAPLAAGDRLIGAGAGMVMSAAGQVWEIRDCAFLPTDSVTPPSGQQFITFGSRELPNGCHVYAVTSGGVVFRKWVQCGGVGWEPAGSLPIAPTNATRSSWGMLQIRYR